MKQHKFCCDNDLGEGGHRYGDTVNSQKIPPALGGAGAGDFEDNDRENICNDYISDYQASDISGWIDNDCDGDDKCEDSSCKPLD